MNYMIEYSIRRNGGLEQIEADLKSLLKAFSKWQPEEGLNVQAFVTDLNGDGGYVLVEATDPKVVANEGFTEVTIFVDAERWVQVGTELYRTEPDGTRVLVGAYAFRDVQLNPDFPPDTFTPAGMKK